MLWLPPTSVTMIWIRAPAPRTISVAVRWTVFVVPWNQLIPGRSGDTLRLKMFLISIVSMPPASEMYWSAVPRPLLLKPNLGGGQLGGVLSSMILNASYLHCFGSVGYPKLTGAPLLSKPVSWQTARM